MTDQTPAEPTRPFESLDWYRQAARSGSGGLGTGARLLDWARGIGFLTLHISIFALGIVTMFVVNLLRSPDRIWVDRAIPIWTLIVIIHAVVVGLLWAIGQLNREDDGPLLVVSDAQWRTAATWDGSAESSPPTISPAPSPPPRRPEVGTETTPQFRPSHAAETHPERPASPAPNGATPGWSSWESEVPQRLGPNDPDRASWQEAETAARRGRTAASPPPDPPEGDAPKGS